MDKGAWQATVHGVRKESDMTERLNNKINSDVEALGGRDGDDSYGKP